MATRLRGLDHKVHLECILFLKDLDMAETELAEIEGVLTPTAWENVPHTAMNVGKDLGSVFITLDKDAARLALESTADILRAKISTGMDIIDRFHKEVTGVQTR